MLRHYIRGPARRDVRVQIAQSREFRARLLAFVSRRVRDPGAAEDIVQEIMLRIHRHAGSLRDSSAVSGWVFQIARNAITDHYRAAARRELPAGTDLGPAPALPAGPDDERVRAELAACLAPLMAGLAAADREALTLTEFSGMTQADAARRLGLSVSGMKSRVQRARARLRQQLTDCCQVEQDHRGAITGYRPRQDPCDCQTPSGG